MPREDDAPRDRDDYEDRPRPRKSSGSGLIIGLIVGGVLLVVLACGGVMVGLLLPAVSKVREAASRAQDQNNMKQLSLSFHNEQDARMSVSSLARDRSGKVSPGLSWRVSMLPYIEQENLYSSFDFTQAWDSPRNQPHSNTTVPTYRTPFDGGPGTGTPYRVFVGGGAMFEPDGRPVRFADVTDGIQNTILFIHATEQVPWAQPKELPYSPTAPLPAFGHKGQPNGTNVAMADGSVRFISKNASEASIRAAITRAGNEQVPLDW
jgi:prepilin-type processing-associated H-X9-DG protein